MNTKSVFFLLVAFSGFCPLVFGANIQEVRKEALKKIEANKNLVKEANEEVNLKIQSLQNNINVISYGVQSHGTGIEEKTHEELYKLSVSFGMRAALLKVKPEIATCVERAHKQAQDVYGKFAEEEFDDPSYNLEINAGNVFRDKLFKWYNLYHNKTANYTTLYKQVSNDIAVSNIESEIAQKVTYFVKETKNFIDYIYSFVYTSISDQNELLKKLIVLLDKLRDFSRKTADQTGQQMEKCFPKMLSLLTGILHKNVN